MNRPLLMALVLVSAACATAADNSTISQAATCEEPPADEVTLVSELDVTVSPNPAAARHVVELTVMQSDLPDDSVVGVDAQWQCWDGSMWATTHIIYRGFGDNAGQTIPVNSEFQIRVPSIGLALGTGHPIVIPEVEPGTYRIMDEVLAGGESVTGFAIVEVVSS